MADLLAAAEAVLAAVPDAANSWQETGMVAVPIPAVAALREAVRAARRDE